MDAEAGMLRLVFGLGTRAVDRTQADHARIVALDEPLRGRLSDPDDLSAFSQRRVDVLDLPHNTFATVRLDDLLGSDITRLVAVHQPRLPQPCVGWPSGVGRRRNPWSWPTSGGSWGRRSRR